MDRKRNAPVTRKGVNVTGERAGKPPYFELQAMNDDSDVILELIYFHIFVLCVVPGFFSGDKNLNYRFGVFDR